MTLSIITPVYKGAKELGKFLEKIREQTSKDFEIILIVDTTYEGVLDIIQKHVPKLGSKIKIIFNSKRGTRTSAINLGAKSAKGKYSIIMSLHNSFNNKFISEAVKVIKDKKTDIIEFKARFSSPIKFNGTIRKDFSKPTDIDDNSEIHAFTYPVDFNKFFKTDVLVHSAKYKLPVQLNSRFSIDATYLSLLVAKTYSTINKVFVVGKSRVDDEFNPIKMIRQWESLMALVAKYTSLASIERYIYAQYYAESVLISAFVKATKNKPAIKKFNEKFKKQKTSEFALIFEKNKYANTIAKEYIVLSNYVSIHQLPKIHKELG